MEELIGQTVELEALKTTPQGVYLITEKNDELLLPNKYVPRDLRMGDKIKVFVYNDFDNRPVATTLTPKVHLNQVGFLKCFDVSDYGAFFDWGLEKHLLVPFSEQHYNIEAGDECLVYLYKDEKTNRLVGSIKIDKFLKNNVPSYNVGDKVNLIVGGETDLGFKVIVENQFLGLIYKNELFKKVKQGDLLTGYITTIREDNKLDISLNSARLSELEVLANKIYETLLRENGAINISDKSDPEVIYKRFQVSKKAFKRAVGLLYSERKIVVNPQSIVLAEN
ncbi:MAG: GntR family transcriptional regulator [Flavobacteriales bacterium]|nr:GntR family transcriptional regulator [Flavobacteriales bacterium]MCB9365198.1 GntR family transcriptional regulator [Flavobacteriales bacterium]